MTTIFEEFLKKQTHHPTRHPTIIKFRKFFRSMRILLTKFLSKTVVYERKFDGK